MPVPGRRLREEEHAPVEPDLGGSRQHVGDEATGRRRPGGEDKAERPLATGQHQALGEELPEQPPAAGAERGADGHLPVARRRAREEQVGHIGAGDEEHEGDGAEQDEQRQPHVTDDLLDERLDRRGHAEASGG